jgi:hypothetical protein
MWARLGPSHAAWQQTAAWATLVVFPDLNGGHWSPQVVTSDQLGPQQLLKSDCWQECSLSSFRNGLGIAIQVFSCTAQVGSEDRLGLMVENQRSVDGRNGSGSDTEDFTFEACRWHSSRTANSHGGRSQPTATYARLMSLMKASPDAICQLKRPFISVDLQTIRPSNGDSRSLIKAAPVVTMTTPEWIS